LKVVRTVSEARAEAQRARLEGKSIGFFPTLGAMHEGHMTLVRRSCSECDFAAVSIFLNPTQFGENEDLDKYPRTMEADLQKCRDAGVDLVFAPPPSEMYPEGFDCGVEVGGPTNILEGKLRPGHFRGVATVCTKLFNILDPDRAYFARKDYQQLLVIEKLVRDLNLRVRIVRCDTVREPDGLAMSSRNTYLDQKQRQAALVLSRSLQEARKAYGSGERNARAIQAAVENLIKHEPLAVIDYVEVRDAETLHAVGMIENPAVVLLAVKIGATRLIDNVVLE